MWWSRKKKQDQTEIKLLTANIQEFAVTVIQLRLREVTADLKRWETEHTESLKKCDAKIAAHNALVEGYLIGFNKILEAKL